jgi:hypothetical protein
VDVADKVIDEVAVDVDETLTVDVTVEVAD